MARVNAKCVKIELKDDVRDSLCSIMIEALNHNAEQLSGELDSGEKADWLYRQRNLIEQDIEWVGDNSLPITLKDLREWKKTYPFTPYEEILLDQLDFAEKVALARYSQALEAKGIAE